jgi:hypothetical protein
MSSTDWHSRTQHVDIENNKPASPDDHIIPISLRNNSVSKMKKSKSRGRIARKLNFNPKPKKKSICSGVNCSIQGGRRRTKRRRKKRTKRRRRKRRKTRRKNK